jgi:hypothetical protein
MEKCLWVRVTDALNLHGRRPCLRRGFGRQAPATLNDAFSKINNIKII